MQTPSQTLSQRVSKATRRHQTPRTYSPGEWESLRPTITKLHKTNTAKDLRSILEDDYKFFVKYDFSLKMDAPWPIIADGV
jgi:hypothetical protein